MCVCVYVTRFGFFFSGQMDDFCAFLFVELKRLFGEGVIEEVVLVVK